MTDVLIAGAGPAGLEAALVLARAGRSVVVLDGGPGRNAPAAHAHNVFTRDGAPPDELRRIGREQAEGYGARFLEGWATDAEAGDDGVRLRLADGADLAARRLLLATGVEDLLPDIPGVAEAWGETVAHCPYCHGHELRGRPTVVLGAGAKGVHLAGLLLGWTDQVTLCCGPDGVADAERRHLGALGVVVEEHAVSRLDVDGHEVRAVEFADGSRLKATAVYVQPGQRPRGPLPEALGLALTEANPAAFMPPGLVAVDPFGKTSAPNVWACGDVTSPLQAVQLAASSGFTAAAMINHDLLSDGARYAPEADLATTP
jgi:thioredoxin reductase (NADPH)